MGKKYVMALDAGTTSNRAVWHSGNFTSIFQSQDG